MHAFNQQVIPPAGGFLYFGFLYFNLFIGQKLQILAFLEKSPYRK